MLILMATECKLSADLIDPEVLRQAAEVLRVLSHHGRLRIVELLEKGRRSVGQLAQELELPPAATSQHLSHMRAHGILSAQRQGKEVFYRVANPNALSVLRCIRRHGTGRADV